MVNQRRSSLKRSIVSWGAVLSTAAGLAISAHAFAAGADAPSKEALKAANALSEAFRGAADSVADSVVSITGSKTVSERDQMGGLSQQMPEELFKRFFGGDAGPSGGLRAQPHARPHQQERMGEGSGVVVRDNGYILTNNHVVDGMDRLIVRLADGREFDAKVVGVDPDSDLAVVKIDATGLTAAKIGDADALRTGDWVVAVGTPFGLEHTVTAGIVSAKGRANLGLNQFEDFIQTDAAVNPGNSGGPLVNLNGEVVGINTAIRTASGGSNGIGFAIPSTSFKPVMETLIAGKTVERGWMGVAIQPLTRDLATSLHSSASRGALVSEVSPGTPAAKAGVQPGDVITEVNHRAIEGPSQLVTAVSSYDPGKAIDLNVQREGKPLTLSVTLGKRPGSLEKPGGTESPSDSASPFGLTLQPLDKELRDKLNVKQSGGLVVADVEDGSAAARAGLQSGDVILEAAGKPISEISDFTAAAHSAQPDTGILLRVQHGTAVRFIVLKSK